jgi:hypothetical protein
MVHTWYFALGLSLAAVACREGSEVTAPSQTPTIAQSKTDSNNPRWWNKYQFLLKHGPSSGATTGMSSSVGRNVNVSNECGPQSETFIALNPNNPSVLTAGSNEIFRLPMEAYFSSNQGSSWGRVDVPLPLAPSGKSTNRFGSDPTLGFDTRGTVFYGFIVVFWNPQFSSINGTELAVARSADGGQTWASPTEFSFEGGQNHFNDKPMLTVDQNADSRFRDNVYVAWDAATGGSPGGGIRVARSTDHGASFVTNRADDPRGPGRSIGAVPFVGPEGNLYVAWNDYAANVIAFNRSADGGATWGRPGTVAAKSIPFDISVPAEMFRGALVYPACDADRSRGTHRGRLYCSWMDLNPSGNTQIVLSYSDDAGSTWSQPAPIGHQSAGADRFNHWLSVDAVTGDVTAAYYNATGFVTDFFLSRSTDGSANWLADERVTSQTSNEHDCSGLFPCPSIDYGNQQGDYEGLVSFAGVSHPIWTDSRKNTKPAGGPPCGDPNTLMEEVFSAAVTH